MSRSDKLGIFSRKTLIPSINGRLGRINTIALIVFWSYVATLPIFVVGFCELIDIHLHITHLYFIPEPIRITAFLLPTFIYSALSVAVIIIRRLHDMNLRGSWLFVGIVCYTAIFQLAEKYFYHMPMIIFFLPLIAVAIVTIVPGTSSSNRFGSVTANVSKLSSFLVFISTVILCAVILPLLYYLLMILAMSAWVGHC